MDCKYQSLEPQHSIFGNRQVEQMKRLQKKTFKLLEEYKVKAIFFKWNNTFGIIHKLLTRIIKYIMFIVIRNEY